MPVRRLSLLSLSFSISPYVVHHAFYSVCLSVSLALSIKHFSEDFCLNYSTNLAFLYYLSSLAPHCLKIKYIFGKCMLHVHGIPVAVTTRHTELMIL